MLVLSKSNSVLEELSETNVGFRFLHKPDQTQSGAILFLQWCLAPQVVQYLKDEKVDDAMVFVSVFSPRFSPWGQERRFVFPLTSPQELIEFHCPGEHQVLGMVVWGNTYGAANNFLEKRGRSSYKYSLGEVMERCNYQHLCWSFGEAKLSVEVAGGFFAPEMSPWMEWYVNLWFGEKPWDECEIRRRKWVAFTIQSVVLALWVPLIVTIRAVTAFWLSVMCLRKNVPWEAVMHPFDYDTSDLNSRSEKRWGVRSLFYLLVPLNHLFILALTLILTSFFATRYGVSDPMLGAYTYGLFVAILMAYILTTRLVTSTGALGKLTKVVRQLNRRGKEREKRLMTERLDAVYADLLCTAAPADGTLRPIRRGFKNNAVLAYHNLKAAVCRPTARG